MKLDRAQAREVARAAILPAILVAVDLVLIAALARASDGGGLLTPSGTVRTGALIVGASALVARLFAIVVAPGWVVYRVAARAMTIVATQRDVDVKR